MDFTTIQNASPVQLLLWAWQIVGVLCSTWIGFRSVRGSVRACRNRLAARRQRREDQETARTVALLEALLETRDLDRRRREWGTEKPKASQPLRAVSSPGPRTLDEATVDFDGGLPCNDETPA